MDEERRFRVLNDYAAHAARRVSSVPWPLVEPHRKQATANHYQSLEQLNGRGGLDPQELWCVAHGVSWQRGKKLGLTGEKAREWLAGLEGVEWEEGR